MPDTKSKPAGADRLAKVIARAGMCSRREAEQWIAAGRVSVNDVPVRTPAFNVTPDDRIAVDGAPLAERSGTRVWLYHKPAGLVVTEKDPEGRPTIFESLARHGLPRVLTVGRLDINTEGLLLLTNDGGLKRVLELPATGWLRRYRVRAFGRISQAELGKLKNGMELEGIKYGPIEAALEREQGANVWLNVGLREGKNREVKNVLEALGLKVNRLIRVSYGPFQLGEMPIGAVSVVKARILREQLGHRLAAEAGVDFDSPMPELAAEQKPESDPNRRLREKPDGRPPRIPRPRRAEEEPEKPARRVPERRGNFERKQRPEYVKPVAEKRVVHFSDGRPSAEFEPKARRAKPDEDKGRDFKPRSGGERDARGGKPVRDQRGPRDRKDEKPRGPKRDGAPPRRDGDRPHSGKPPSRPGGPRKGPPRGGRKPG